MSSDDSIHEPPGGKMAKNRTVHIKMLIPAKVAGIIIGKGGASINKLQQDSNSKIKISKSHELVPGTDERVCLINGDIKGIMLVYDSVQEVFKSRPDAVSADMASDRVSEVQILVPNSTAGLLIGRGGAHVKQISQDTNAKIIISQRVDGVPERLVVISSSSDSSRRLAFEQVITKIRDDPHHDSCANVFYSGSSGGGGGAPEPAPVVTQRPAPTGTLDMIDRLLAEAGGLSPGNVDILLSIMRERFNFNGEAALDVLKAVDILSRYGLLPSSIGPSRLSPPPVRPESHLRHVQIRVPNRVVGALVGPGGRSLAALEARSGGASVHISPRDDRMSERTVTIEAPYADVLERALELVSAVVTREESRQSRRSID